MATLQLHSNPAVLKSSQIDSWFGAFGLGIGGDSPSAEEMRLSMSWRVTEPLRSLRARERLRALRSGTLRLPQTQNNTNALALARQALLQRLKAVAPHLLTAQNSRQIDELSLEHLLGALIETVHTTDDHARLWLLTIAISGCFPDQAQILGMARDIHGVDGPSAVARILHHCGVWTSRYQSHLRTIEMVTDVPLAFCDFTARFGFNSGIQRVTRQTLSFWRTLGDFRLAAVTSDGTSLRTLDEEETTRVLDWSGDDDANRDDIDDTIDHSTSVLVVPWNTTVFVPEAPLGHGTNALIAMARFSPNRTVAIGYDTIPVSGGHFVHRGLTLIFVSYLSMIKYFDEVVCISQATADEFIGFNEALVAQGLTGPRVSTVVLPLEPIPSDRSIDEPAESSLPTVLSVSSNEPRKNQLSVVYASELLWREGLKFNLVLLGGRGDRLFTDVPDAVAALRAKGRTVELRRDVDEAGLAEAYRRARFSIFVSLQEGYGLPIAESLAVGTPAITTDYGSTAEIAAGGGCVTVDPRDDLAIAAAMRELLTSDETISRLKTEISTRVDSTWGDYATVLWDTMTASKGSK
ncbi:glycosyltransferase [Subtercola frigoramans]|uniref:Glycosyltransferase involved in cell wall biosynthesis n=1 Tax=Subtercola frigoramans TaxID=120298 RepID=A0ABS2L870_9MICO|nr:glycosyltransferase [Subtercola frigoramans]MBM7473292.1 glycosyltransferase involved in cell wall biosynthesis [Subtercola frigoramans]